MLGMNRNTLALQTLQVRNPLSAPARRRCGVDRPLASASGILRGAADVAIVGLTACPSVAHHTRRCCRSPTRPGSSISRRGLLALGVHAAVDRRHGAGRWPMPGLPVTEIGALHRLSGNARRPRQDAAPEGARRHPRAARPGRARAALAAHAIPTDRSRRGQSLSVSRDGRQAGLHARRRDREHRHRRPGDGARGGEELARMSASSSIRPTTPAARRTRDSERGALVAARRAFAWRRRRSRTRQPTTARSATG